MTDTNQTELESYKRVLERERRAKKLAEKQLEDYSREIYNSNTLLKEQTKHTQTKQQHLAFLISVAEDNFKSESVSELVTQYLQKSAAFLRAPSSAYFQIETDLTLSRFQVVYTPNIAELNVKPVASEEIESVLSIMDLRSLKKDFIERDKGGLFSSYDYINEPSPTLAEIQIYLMPVVESKGKALNKLSCMCFFYKDYDDVDLLKLQTIEASHSIFSVAIERKKAESALKTKLLELEQSNEELSNIQQQLIESEKLASLGQLSAGIAHEINNPVGFVLSNLTTMTDYIKELQLAMAPLNEESLPSEDVLKQWRKLSEQYDTSFLLEDTQTILKSSLSGLDRVKQIVSDLSSFSRMDTDELSPVDVNQVIQSALNILHNELKYNHTVDLQLQSGIEILGNEGQLQQVFINFIVNAKQAMADGGSIVIKSEKIKERVVVTIKDCGCGIPPEAIKEIFTPFYTTKPPGQGTGLGLSISYSILQRHHAKINVDSVVNQGTTFTLSFIST